MLRMSLFSLEQEEENHRKHGTQQEDRVSDGMELSSGIHAIETGSNRQGTAESFSLPASTARPMIPEPHEPFDINRKEDSIFLLGSMFTVIFLFLL